ncbi:MAG: hypothetical protein GY789_10515 [Hyphomicrobiales bacterium]|nr:hypothetical protein [Hyphomicrobiales bacterium]
MTGETDEWEWEAFTATAFEAYQSGRRAEAVHLWRRAGELSSTFTADDPRQAASANNLAISSLVAGQYEEAVTGFAEALAMWDGAESWTERMETQSLGRSSQFHLRMAERHKGAFATIRRSRSREALNGARALTRFNEALALFFLDRDAEADELLAQAAAERETCCGPNNPELSRMIDVIAGRCESAGNKAEAAELDLKARSIKREAASGSLERWKDERPVEPSDTRRLLAAVYLTSMVHERDFL